MEDRIKQIMESQNLTQQNFAQILDLSPASLSSIFNHRTKPTMNHVEAIHKRFPNINMQWLLFGEGTMYGKSADTQSPSSLSSQPSIFGSQLSSTPQSAAGERSLFDQTGSSQFVHSGGRSSSVNSQTSNIQSVKIIDKQARKISEIRIFYDDQTWETFVAKK